MWNDSGDGCGITIDHLAPAYTSKGNDTNQARFRDFIIDKLRRLTIPSSLSPARVEFHKPQKHH